MIITSVHAVKLWVGKFPGKPSRVHRTLFIQCTEPCALTASSSEGTLHSRDSFVMCEMKNGHRPLLWSFCCPFFLSQSRPH